MFQETHSPFDHRFSYLVIFVCGSIFGMFFLPSLSFFHSPILESPSLDSSCLPTTKDKRQQKKDETNTTTQKNNTAIMTLTSSLNFSACLLIKDDNHWLVEWIAYHYHVLPLRHLIVLPDPTSRTSPQPILDRWKDRIDIELWNDTVIGHVKPTNGNVLVGIKWEQVRLYQACLKYYKSRGKTWVLLTDTDEFLDLYIPDHHKVILPMSNEKTSRIKTKEAYTKKLQTKMNQTTTIGLPTAALAKPGFFATYLSQLQATKKITVFNDPNVKKIVCISVARFPAPAKEIDPKDWDRAQRLLQINAGVYNDHVQEDNAIDRFDRLSFYPNEASHDIVNPLDMLTTRFLYYQPDVLDTLLPKVLVDVSAMDWKDFPEKPPFAPIGMHQVIPKHCAEARLYQFFGARPNLRIVQGDQDHPRLFLRHFTGTREQYVFRDDPRGFRKGAAKMDRWIASQKAATVMDLSLIPWLRGFVEHVGINEAKRLLQGVGDVRIQ